MTQECSAWVGFTWKNSNFVEEGKERDKERDLSMCPLLFATKKEMVRQCLKFEALICQHC